MPFISIKATQVSKHSVAPQRSTIWLIGTAVVPVHLPSEWITSRLFSISTTFWRPKRCSSSIVFAGVSLFVIRIASSIDSETTSQVFALGIAALAAATAQLAPLPPPKICIGPPMRLFPGTKGLSHLIVRSALYEPMTTTLGLVELSCFISPMMLRKQSEE
jgi:hypothetical protein